jgi:hypothetical protein
MFVRAPARLCKALTLLAESLCDEVPSMTVRRQQDEITYLLRRARKAGISNSNTLLTSQGFVNLCVFVSVFLARLLREASEKL